jgi:hypothetical protein
MIMKCREPLKIFAALPGGLVHETGKRVREFG